MSLRFHEASDAIFVFFTSPTEAGELPTKECDGELPSVCDLCVQSGKPLIVDCRGIQQMTSMMIGELLLLNEVTKQYAVVLRFAHVDSELLSALRVLRLDQVFLIDGDETGSVIFL